MEAIAGNQYSRVINAPRMRMPSGDFQCALNRFSARVGDKNAIQPADLRQSLGEGFLCRNMDDVGGVDQLRGLICQRCCNSGVSVPKAADSNSA